MSSSISQDGLNMIVNFEGFRQDAYKDVAGRWTIGYGCTDPEYAMPGGHITKEKAMELLREDVNLRTMAVRRACDVPPNQHQLDAMISLCYNIGEGVFRKSSVVALHNKRDFVGASDAFLKWDKYTDPATGKLKPSAGLSRRRKAEAAMYLQENNHLPEPRILKVKPEATPLSRSRTLWGAGVAAGGTAATQVIDQVQMGISALTPLASYLSFARWIILFMVMSSIGLVVYSKIQSHKKGK